MSQTLSEEARRTEAESDAALQRELNFDLITINPKFINGASQFNGNGSFQIHPMFLDESVPSEIPSCSDNDESECNLNF